MTSSTASTSSSLRASRSSRRTTATAPRSSWHQRVVGDGGHPTRSMTMELRPITKTVKTPAANFTGDVYLNPVFSDDDAPLVVGLVRFTPGARTNWHSHANGQLLVCTEVVGLVAGRAAPARSFDCVRASPSGPRQGRSTGTAASPIRGTALSVH